MLANESCLRVCFMRFNSEVVYQKLFQKYWKRLLVKNKKVAVNCASTYESNKYILKIKQKKRKFEVLVIPVAIESLLYLTPS